jgi:hypothetical protein
VVTAVLGDDDRGRARRLGESAPPLSDGQARAVRRIVHSTWRLPHGDLADVRAGGEIVVREEWTTLGVFDSEGEAEDFLLDIDADRV